MAVTPGLRLPVIGTSLITAPGWLRRHLVASALREPFFNLELHGIDLCDADTHQERTQSQLAQLSHLEVAHADHELTVGGLDQDVIERAQADVFHEALEARLENN